MHDLTSAGRQARLLAGNDPATPGPVLAELGTDKDPEVRAAVAGNPNCPSERLEGLASAKDWRIRQTVAANPATPPEVLDWLAADRDDWVRSTTALHRKASPETLGYLAKDASQPVRANVAANPATPPEVLSTLARDPDPEVAANARTTRRQATAPSKGLAAIPVPPPEIAEVPRVGLRREEVDSVVVERAVAGENLRLSASERFEVWRALTLRGDHSQRSITDRLKLSTQTLASYRDRLSATRLAATG